MTEFKVVKDWGENADPNSKQAIVYELYKADRGTGHNRTSIGTFMLDANGGYMLDTTDYLVAHNEQLSSTPWTMSHYADTSAGAPEYWFEVEEKGLYTVTGTGETATWSVTTIDTNYLKVSYKAQPDGDYRDGTLKESWKDDWGWALLDIWDSHEGTPQLTIRNLGALKLTKLVTVNEGDPASLNKPLQDAADGDYYFSIVGPVTRVTRYVYICISGGRMQYYSVLHPEDEGCTLDWADDNSVYHYDWVNGYCLDGTYWGQYYLDDNDESHYLGQWSGYTDRSVREALIGDLPVGEYVITERRPSNGTTLASITGGKLYEDQNGGAAHNNANLTNGTVTVDVAAGETFDATGHVSVTYTNNKNTGALRLKKIVTYNSGECDKLPDTDANRRKLDGDYPFSISGPAPSNEVIQYVKIRIENGEEVCYLLSKVNTDAAWRLAVQDYTNNTNEGVSWKRADPLGLKLEHLLPGDYVVTELGFTTDSGLITTMAKIYGGKEVEDAGNDAYNGANLDTRTVTLTVTADDNPEMESEAFVAYTNDYSEGSLGLKKLVEAHTSYPVNGNKGYFDSSYFDFTVNGPVKADGTPESDAITKYVRIYVKNTGDNSVVLNYYYEVKDSSSEFEGVDSATQLQSGQNPYVPIPNLKYGDYIITESGAWSVPNAPAGTDVYLKGVLLRCYKGAQGMDYIDCHPDMANRSVRVSVDNTHDGDVVVVIFTNELEPSTATIKKQVTDLNDSEESTSIQYNENPWYDSADYDINDRVPYRVTGYLPQKIYRDPARTHYWYQVVDEMYNLDFDESSARMYAFVKGPTDVQGSWFDVSRYFRHYAVTSLGNNGTRIKTDLVDIKTIKIGNRVYKWDAAQDTHGSAYPYGDPVTIADQPITPADIQYLQLRYMAVLKDTAAFGATGNMNQAKLNYGENNDVLSSTDWDKNKVFTYKLSFAKQDENGTAMPGATFTLYKKYLSYDATGKGLYAGAKIIDGTEYPVLSKTPFTAGQSVATGKHEEYYIQVGEEQGGANVTTFEWNGIDDGRYLLEETGAPTGYQKQMLAFSIAADHDLRHDDPPLNWIRVPKQNETIVPEAAGYIGSAELNTGIITLKSGESATGIKNYPYPDIDLEKIDQDTRNTQSVKHLAGAQFQILKWNGSQYASYVPYMPTTSSTGSSGSSSSASSGLLPGEVVTDDNGLAVFPKVEPGEYVIKETKVPDGYIKLVTNDIYINVAYDATKNVHTITWYEEAYDGTNDSSRTKITDTSETLGVTFTQATAANGDNPASDAMFTVGNTPGARLPNSGGPGTTLFYVVGSIITLLAAVLLVTKRRSYDGD